jgi:hypothetical protein
MGSAKKRSPTVNKPYDSLDPHANASIIPKMMSGISFLIFM